MNASTASKWEENYSRALRLVALGGAILSCFIVGIIVLYFLYSVEITTWQEIAREHFLGTVGFTGAAILSFGIVIFLRQTEGPVEFEALGMKFRGAAGQVVLWAFCFLVICIGARILW